MPKVFRFREYGGPQTQEFAEVDKPEPGPGQLLLQVRAAGVNPYDHKVRSGLFKDGRELPSEFGGEVSGVIEQIGAGVEGFSVGDAVFGWPAPGYGAFSEYTIVAQDGVVAKPPQVSFVDAAALPVASATAYDGLAQLGLSAGQTLLITGIGGGVGVAAVQLARNAGIRVVGTGSQSKRALVESLGAELVDYGDGVSERLSELLPDGVDGVFDLVSGPALSAVAGLVKDPGKLISAVSPETVTELGGAFIRRDSGLRGLAEVARLAAEGVLNPQVTSVVAFSDAPKAIAAVESGHPLGKVVLQVS
ncbi:MAG TPA: NADP-dependent oxidoreductase [Jatrophihabitans sp.]|jgi:NADPH2:quinone reductase|uniref:NADP-dependent oxidoreductase n=1 Tax=Jatrophihabitans sp. TaxID=1932789 RepID=UPI002EE8098D